MGQQRVALPHRYVVPSRADIVAHLETLIHDPSPATRAHIAKWAAEYFLYDGPQIYPQVEDEVVWEALSWLGSADLITVDRPYLYDVEDFLAWRLEVESAPRE